jgi:hypothetical protein
MIPKPIRSTKKLLSKQRAGFQEAAQYLKKHTDPNDFYLDAANFQIMTLTTGRPSFQNTTLLQRDEFKQAVKKYGFASAMDRYKIKLLVTNSKSEPPYIRFVGVFTDDLPPPRRFTRTHAILSKIDGIPFYDNQELHQQYVERLKIKDKFRLAAEIGRYRLYYFKD